jgi:hypothetical protein
MTEPYCGRGYLLVAGHAIVNRRNSPPVQSILPIPATVRVEMAVASTKAFYAQISAGKLTALLLAQEFSTLSEEEIYEEIQELEKLPAEIESVLEQCHSIKEAAEKYGPTSRNCVVEWSHRLPLMKSELNSASCVTSRFHAILQRTRSTLICQQSR